MHKWIRRGFVLVVVLAVVAGSGSFATYRATQWVPPFYAQKLDVDAAELEQAGEELEEKFEKIQQEHADEQVWTTVLTEDQVNGWLAVNLRQKFPRLLPPSVRQPRVAFAPGEAQIACQYVSPNFTAVISLNVDASATEQPNVVAVRLRNARMGAVPGLMEMAREEIDQAAKRAQVDVQWTQQDGDDVALVTIPDHVIDERHRFELHDVEISAGELRIAGQLVPAAPDASATVQKRADPTLARPSHNIDRRGEQVLVP